MILITVFHVFYTAVSLSLSLSQLAAVCSSPQIEIKSGESPGRALQLANTQLRIIVSQLASLVFQITLPAKLIYVLRGKYSVLGLKKKYSWRVLKGIFAECLN